MEYFDFDGASYGSQARDDDVASNTFEIDESDATANCDSLLLEQPLDFSNQMQEQNPLAQKIESLPDNGQCHDTLPIFRAKVPCDFCRHMNLECFVVIRGVLQNGCTCCISLYRECSFTHAKVPGKFMDTLHAISENVDIPTGGPTGRKTLKSLTGMTTSEDKEGRGRKSSSRLSRDAVRILKTWLLEHLDHPYPSEDEKDELKRRTGLKRTQISNWLANARRRGKGQPSPLSTCSASGAIDIPGQRQQQQQHPNIALMTPLERWKYSPPENEPAATSDILRALVNTPLDSTRQSGHVRSLSRKESSNDSSHANSNIFKAPSNSSLGTSRSASRSSVSDLSFASAFSHRSSLESFGSMDRKDRRRRRKPSTALNPFNQQKARSARIFQCTFCTDSFATKYDWQRHEKSLHLALEKWTCSPHGGVVYVNGANRCVFCMASDPDTDHLESHCYSTCQEKTVAERTFYRKDHLNQHLRLMHNVKFNSYMAQWQSTTTELKSRCGFCGTTLSTWKDRVEHIAAHFKNGAEMAQWQGDWGFEPFVQGLVENAMPPYLIGQERKTLDPYTTSRSFGPSSRTLNDAAPRLSEPDDANCFHRLQRELTAFIHSNVAEGIIPTDQMIQDHARTVIYSNADPWNQTCADNAVWLSILKRDAGLEMVPEAEKFELDNIDMQPPFAMHGGLRQPPVEKNVLARSICSKMPLKPENFSPALQSPAFPGTGRSSVAASMPGSSAASYVGSFGAAPSGVNSGLSTDWGSNLSAGVSSSFATPVSGSVSVDPFVQMGFEPEFLQQLNNRYGEMQLDDMEGIMFDMEKGRDTEVVPESDVYKMSSTADDGIPASNVGSAPSKILNPGQTGVGTHQAQTSLKDVFNPSMGGDV
ncbi:putative homeobox and C2H2 transcription factor [Aspergillus clavatus NRRL 1]|uniref:Homeobox and C2H2 transcription factor, putative n=1 Tax=Aspergillus clavatus (strain ATCC 1007 / CBS 513.65 / DSM 816 / NCTC 3887 / NRRL 1 / QM 1276 / 107) TaxID=344612 RepID=A1CNQ5_ASPCL|nr:homeobox and C2H2 transcription factor, putative [Aspergillus clavatus NRRL 1]EAW07276.1 homeobox and C2H2 transcription factor, putative [Aspergillus clavatus NRRL 1]